jgi:hypothetical protein
VKKYGKGKKGSCDKGDMKGDMKMMPPFMKKAKKAKKK